MLVIRKYLFTVLVCCVFSFGNSQERRAPRRPVKNYIPRLKYKMSYGYYLGGNFHNFAIKYKNFDTNKQIVQSNKLGFNIGLIGNYNFNKYIHFRIEPGLCHSERTLLYPFLDEKRAKQREIASNYIRIPVLIKIIGKRYNNMRPYIITGFSAATNFSSNETNKDDNRNKIFRMTTDSYNYEIGGGFEFFFLFFKMAVDLKAVLGLKNELIPDEDPNSPWTGNLESLKSRAFLINIKVQ